MSVLGALGRKQLWKGVLVSVIAILAAAAVGALLTTAGIVPVPKAWSTGCAAWLLGGWLGGRFAAKGEERPLIQSGLNIAVTAMLFWLAGLTVPGGSVFADRSWVWYVVCALLGAVMAAAAPQKKKRRRRGKRGR